LILNAMEPEVELGLPDVLGESRSRWQKPGMRRADFLGNFRYH